MTGELILSAVALAAGIGIVIWARWSGHRVESNDPAQQKHPAE